MVTHRDGRRGRVLSICMGKVVVRLDDGAIVTWRDDEIAVIVLGFAR